MADDRTPRTISLTERPPEDVAPHSEEGDEDNSEERLRKRSKLEAAASKKASERHTRRHPDSRLF
ncbi:MAG: hypothetical protein ACR2KQ_04895 [Actinomycetota bacterium]